MVLYYLHERGWNKIKWAKEPGPEEHTTIFPYFDFPHELPSSKHDKKD